MRAAGATVLLTVVLLTGCGGDDAAAPTPSTSASATVVDPSPESPSTPPVETDDPVVEQPLCAEVDEVDVAVCRFVTAVQSGDLTSLSPEEQAVAAQVVDLPEGPYDTSCELVGDVTVLCELTFSATTVGLYVAPSNAEYEDGALTTQDGQPVEYAVVEYLGTGEPGSFGQD